MLIRKFTRRSTQVAACYRLKCDPPCGGQILAGMRLSANNPPTSPISRQPVKLFVHVDQSQVTKETLARSTAWFVQSFGYQQLTGGFVRLKADSQRPPAGGDAA